MSKQKLKIVIIGHVDHGKSTLVGQLLVGTGAIAENRIEAVKKICASQGKKFEFAFLLDALEEEQSQGITIDLTRVPFKTEKRDYEIIDAPGHKEFLKNMISGAAGADVAVIMIDGLEGVCEQSIRHGQIAAFLGIKEVLVLVNKMDLVNYDEEKFLKVQKEFSDFLAQINVQARQFVPVSAFANENIFSKSAKMPWYQGDYFLATLDNLSLAEADKDQTFRFSVQDVYKFDERRIIAGKVLSGKLNQGEEIAFYPSGKTQKVKTFADWPADNKNKIKAGESAGIILASQIFIERGEIGARSQEAPMVKSSLRVNLIWLGEKHFQKGKKYKLKLASQEVVCSLSQIENLVDSASLNKGEKYGAEIAKNEIAQVVLSLDAPLAFDAFSQNPQTGRFVIMDGFQVSGGGIICEDQIVRPDFVI